MKLPMSARLIPILSTYTSLTAGVKVEMQFTSLWTVIAIGHMYISPSLVNLGVIRARGTHSLAIPATFVLVCGNSLLYCPMP